MRIFTVLEHRSLYVPHYFVFYHLPQMLTAL